MASNYISDVVFCDVCNQEAKLEEGETFARCGNQGSICGYRILLPPLIAGKICVRWQCDCSQAPKFRVMNDTTTTFKCCVNDFQIVTDVLAELRCKQIVYRAEFVTPRKEKIEKLAQELETKTAENERLRTENEKIKTERDSLRKKVPFLERSLEEKKSEIRFLRDFVKDGMKTRNGGDCETSVEEEENEESAEEEKKKTRKRATKAVAKRFRARRMG